MSFSTEATEHKGGFMNFLKNVQNLSKRIDYYSFQHEHVTQHYVTKV